MIFYRLFSLNARKYSSPGGLGLDASALLKYCLFLISLLICCLETLYKNVDDERLSEHNFEYLKSNTVYKKTVLYKLRIERMKFIK